jgi:hypothetical protein
VCMQVMIVVVEEDEFYLWWENVDVNYVVEV